MKHIKPFALFESETELTGEQKELLDANTKGSWSVNPTTGLVDVDGDFGCLTWAELKYLLGIQFGVVSGNFKCSYNKLTTLDGAPQEVGGNFGCSGNKLTTLEGAPQEVVGSFFCTNNELTSLKGAPRKVGGDFHCSDNELTTLEGAPQEVGGNFQLELGVGFKWTTEGKLKYMKKNPKWIPLILPTISHDSLLDEVSEDPTLLKTIEDFDKVLYNKVLKGLGWDKMGPDLLRQLKDGIL